ncbi:hypothetical protein [Actinomadura litoris]|uniref:hypothetical protein n=1 Tax=Actinomadura litoris TaxID=2678616 RepID=UPI001FA7ED09|nr:hypothetical protein [Actinomadura litoris]
MKRVRLRHPITGGEFEARETAIDVYRRSGWEVVDEPVAADEGAPALDPLPEPGPSAEPKNEPGPPALDDKSESPRGRRTKKESE